MEVFNALIGEQLSSVIFVQDYLQLEFDGNLFTFYDWPMLKKQDSVITFQNDSYRNNLCAFIAKNVEKVNDIDNVLFEIVFADNSSIYLNLTEAKGEVLYFRFSNGDWGTIAI
jgi:hypothetical protein